MPVTRVKLDEGRFGVIKTGAGVAAEAAGLRWLAVPGGPAVPRVLSCDGERLVSEYVETGPATPASAAVFGQELAAMHGAGAPAFGAAPPGGPVAAWIGNAPMNNVSGEDWPSWYAEHRVLPYLRSARDAGTLDAAQVRPIEQVCAVLAGLAGPAEPPARLHGDLWSGNVLWGASGRVWLIDPAAHGGHRETDLAMLALFGCPYLDVIRSAYCDAAPLTAGWEHRIGLHQLFPLLVHVVLFGGSYAAQAVSAARSALAG